MGHVLKKVLVVGGNGFIGSAICRAALARGFQVTSISSSGRPYQTAKGHTPAWVSQVDWQKGDALHPESFANLFPEVGGVVHTLGTLIEDGRYKEALNNGNIADLLGTIVQTAIGNGGNPLDTEASSIRVKSYESMNRDSALRVCQAFLSSENPHGFNNSRPFVYISAEDIFRPVIPARYIETKREAEKRIEEMMIDKPGYRGVYIRPSLVYHAHQRPLTTPIAALLDLSATLHSKIPHTVPNPPIIMRSLGKAFSSPGRSSPLESIANALTIPPIHVDHVAEAVCLTLDSSTTPIRGVVGVRQMREMIGWAERGEHTSMSVN